jgi:hypothetical protein
VRNLSCLGIWSRGQDSVWELPKNKLEALLLLLAYSEFHVVTCQKTVIYMMLHDELFNLYICIYMGFNLCPACNLLVHKIAF